MKRNSNVLYIDYNSVKNNRKRRLYKPENTTFLKRLRLASDPEPAISIVVKEIDFKGETHDDYVQASDLMAYVFSCDPRHYAAVDIQRIFRGWSKRQVFKKNITMCFNSLVLN